MNSFERQHYIRFFLPDANEMIDEMLAGKYHSASEIDYVFSQYVKLDVFGWLTICSIADKLLATEHPFAHELACALIYPDLFPGTFPELAKTDDPRFCDYRFVYSADKFVTRNEIMEYAAKLNLAEEYDIFLSPSYDSILVESPSGEFMFHPIQGGNVTAECRFCIDAVDYFLKCEIARQQEREQILKNANPNLVTLSKAVHMIREMASGARIKVDVNAFLGMLSIKDASGNTLEIMFADVMSPYVKFDANKIRSKMASILSAEAA